MIIALSLAVSYIYVHNAEKNTVVVFNDHIIAWHYKFTITEVRLTKRKCSSLFTAPFPNDHSFDSD